MNYRTTCIWLVAMSLIAIMSCGCDPAPTSGWGFTLPDGDVEQGKAVYVTLQCNSCHSLPGIEQLAAAEGDEPEISVALGGEVARIKTYGELVSSIINPSHRLPLGYPKEEISDDGVSKMRNYNDVMTVKQLSDIVTFLQSKYEIRPIEPTFYPTYY